MTPTKQPPGLPARFKFRNNPYLPTPPARARRLLVLIGERVQKFGHKLSTLQPSDISRVGFFDHQNLEAIFRELQTQGLVIGKMGVDASGSFHHPIDMDLTLKGWEEFEKLKSGSKGGTYAFLALKFNDPELEAFVSAVLKPSVKNHLGYEVVDMRDVARAGIIDNLMREQIRDAAFVLVDLTHDNSGAYWEAGYAEGLGKPVIYICEQSKFEQAKTHFDTNHCTTVTWSTSDPTGFSSLLIATIRRSMGMFPRNSKD